ncbi:hypothetical protein OTB20_23780 [Streptomyces sp. H27-H1]|uniref:hypothetical protein n=1 Tax=Streptomyces sp. H27-H1 TaxID=2996461 RepID=UPI002270044E|nr:hypothetical protein [Streptomyces sp. H27-H1]MCY0929162.1 hypothetical protein [Streptomyces sp. H27-H1]
MAKLLAGETILCEAGPRENKPFPATGALGVGTFKGRKFVGFQPEVPDKPTWSGRTLTPAEVAVLLAGQALEIDDFVSARTGRTSVARSPGTRRPGRSPLISAPTTSHLGPGAR